MIDSRFYDLAGPFSLGDLLNGLKLSSVPSDKSLKAKISSPANLASAKPGQISFLAHRKHRADLETSEATACLVTEEFAPLVAEKNIIPIISKSPRAHFARVIGQLVQRKMHGGEGAYKKSSSARVHRSAVIGAGAVIGEDAFIGPYCVIGPGVEIGARTIIEAQTMIECAHIGADCKVKSGAQIGGDGFGMDGDESGIVNLPHIGRVMMGDRVFIGSQTCVDRGFLGDTILADDVKVDNLVQIAHNCTIGSGTMIAGHVGISGSCQLGKNVRLGGAVGLADHLIIGDRVTIAASSGVMHNIPDGEYWAGTPALPARDQARLLAATRKLIPKKKK